MRTVLSAIGLFLLACGAQAAQFTNGSFENGTFDGAPFDTLGAGSTAITGWRIPTGSVDWIGSYWQASNGRRSIDMSGNGAGALFQRVNGFTPGQRYRVYFDLSANPDAGQRTVHLTATTSGNQVFDFFYDVTGANSRADMRYDRRNFIFTAVAAGQDFEFLSRERNAFGPAIDNVRLANVVPEPASWAMLIAGFGLVGATARRRRAVAA